MRFRANAGRLLTPRAIGGIRRLVRGFLAPAVVFLTACAVAVLSGSSAAPSIANAQINAACAAEGAVADPANNPGLVSDCAALLAAQDTLAGTGSLNWASRTAITEWDGVTIDGTPQRVTELALPNKSLTGTMPGRLGDLTNLQVLRLESFYYDCGEAGSICRTVEEHELNQLTGPIPAELGSLANLLLLELNGNQLTGPIPAELGGLANLIRLSLSRNQLTGEIPVELGNLTNLLGLFIAWNELSGCIPAGLRDLEHLMGHDLDDTGLPFCDVLLSGLTVSPRSLAPPFDPYHTDYMVLEGPELVTVTPANEHNAVILLLDENDEAIPDADAMLAGYQVDLAIGAATVRVTVVSQDEAAVRVYTIAVTSEDIGSRYDTNDNGVIDRDEAVAAVSDYFNDLITREEVIEVIALYFAGPPDFKDAGPQYGGQLNLAVEHDPFDDNFSPFDGVSLAKAQINSLIFSRLMRSSASGIELDLAEWWEASVDGRQWTVGLKNNVRFHDGRRVTAVDVLYSIKAMAGGFNTLPDLAKLLLIDDFTLRVDFEEPFWDFPREMTLSTSVIVPSGSFEESVHDFTQLVGSGPFKPLEYRRDVLLAVERNPDYYETGLPYLDRVHIFVVPDRGTRQAVFMAEGTDYLGYPFSGLPALTRDEAYTASRAHSDASFAPHPIVFALWFDTQRPPFDDRRMRLATLRAIDDSFLVEGVLGQSEPQSSIPSANFPEWNTPLDELRAIEEWRRYDPDQAKKLLEEAGYPTGFDTVMHIPEGRAAHWTSMAEQVLEMLKRVDINVVLERAPFGEHVITPADRGIKLMPVQAFGGDANAFLREHFAAGGAYNYSRTDIAVPELDPDRPDDIISIQQLLAEEIFYIPLPAPLFARGARVHGPLTVHDINDIGRTLKEVWIEQ